MVEKDICMIVFSFLTNTRGFLHDKDSEESQARHPEPARSASLNQNELLLNVSNVVRVHPA